MLCILAFKACVKYLLFIDFVVHLIISFVCSPLWSDALWLNYSEMYR